MISHHFSLPKGWGLYSQRNHAKYPPPSPADKLKPMKAGGGGWVVFLGVFRTLLPASPMLKASLKPGSLGWMENQQFRNQGSRAERLQIFLFH